MMQRGEELRQELQLLPHPEGGAYRELYRSETKVQHPAGLGERAALTNIYFLLERGDFSALHCVDSDEVWIVLEGGPLELHLVDLQGQRQVKRLASVGAGGEPSCVVPAKWLQAARPATEADYVLCMCLVAPGFDFADFAIPSRAELVQKFPALQLIIHELTRE